MKDHTRLVLEGLASKPSELSVDDKVRLDQLLAEERCQYSRCPGDERCGGPVETRSQNTQYVNILSNYVCVCETHHQELEEYWAEAWNEYWGSVM